VGRAICACVLAALYPLPVYTLGGYPVTKAEPRLLSRLARIEGQVRGVVRMVEEERYCIDVLTQIAAIKAGMARTKPASGPEIPTSKSSRRLAMGDLMRIKAPSVPISVGAGMK